MDFIPYRKRGCGRFGHQLSGAIKKKCTMFAVATQELREDQFMRVSIVVLLAVFCLMTAHAQEDGIKRNGKGEIGLLRKGLEGKTPPQLQLHQWRNTKKELTLDSLAGKVVLLDFWSST